LLSWEDRFKVPAAQETGGTFRTFALSLPATASAQFYNKSDGFHFVCPSQQNVKREAVHFFEVEYMTESGLPHSKQRAFNRDVINPQDGHINCD
jgi:hypothetical protein